MKNFTKKFGQEDQNPGGLQQPPLGCKHCLMETLGVKPLKPVFGIQAPILAASSSGCLSVLTCSIVGLCSCIVRMCSCILHIISM